MSNGDMWPEIDRKIKEVNSKLNEVNVAEATNIKLVTHISKKYVWIYDGQIKWRKRIK